MHGYMDVKKIVILLVTEDFIEGRIKHTWRYN